MMSKEAFAALGPVFASHGWVFFGCGWRIVTGDAILPVIALRK